MRGRSEERTGPSPGRGQIPTGNPPQLCKASPAALAHFPPNFWQPGRPLLPVQRARAHSPTWPPRIQPRSSGIVLFADGKSLPGDSGGGTAACSSLHTAPEGTAAGNGSHSSQGHRPGRPPPWGSRAVGSCSGRSCRGRRERAQVAHKRPRAQLLCSSLGPLWAGKGHTWLPSHRLLTCGHTGVRKSPPGRALCSWGLCSQHHRCSVHPEVRTGRAHTGTGAGRPAPTTPPCIRIAQIPGHKAIRGSCRERCIACPTSPDGRGSGRWPDHSGSPRDCTGTASDSQGPTSLDHTGRCL